jgi:hypothetical protein
MKSLEPFDETRYESIDIDRLVMYTAVELERRGIELSLENIIVGAFTLFPKRFSLLGYPQYPDATRVEKSLWRCKGKKKWIGGKTRHGYQLTDRTRAIARQTAAQLSVPALRRRKVGTRERRKETIVRELMSSPAYLKYAKGSKESVTEADFCYALQGTLDSPKEILRENLASLRTVAEELERGDLAAFLDWLQKQFQSTLDSRA